MFTGIIETLGSIESLEKGDDGAVLRVDLNEIKASEINVGDSIAVNGVCLTVTRLEHDVAQFDVSPETVTKCLIDEWQVGDSVNLESALTLEKPLGGHLVSGHVDGTGLLVERHDADEATRMTFETPIKIGRFIAIKGSITVDGISLTSNTVEDSDQITRFEVTLVPHTLANTTLGSLRENSRVHLEIDLVARYLARLNESGQRV